MVYCPECETDLDLEEDEVDEGEVVSCPECGSDFEVITVNPIDRYHAAVAATSGTWIIGTTLRGTGE